MKIRSALPTAVTTKRLQLRATRPAYAEGLWHAAERSLEELRPWLVWADGASIESIRRFMSDTERAWRAGISWGFTIFVDDLPRGHVGLAKFTPELSSAEIGYWIATDMTGRGLMTEAAGAAVEFAFEDLGLHRIELRAAPENVNSVRVAEKLGFTREGLARSACRGAHGWHDVEIFGLLDTDPRVTGVIAERSYDRMDES